MILRHVARLLRNRQQLFSAAQKSLLSTFLVNLCVAHGLHRRNTRPTSPGHSTGGHLSGQHDRGLSRRFRSQHGAKR